MTSNLLAGLICCRGFNSRSSVRGIVGWPLRCRESSRSSVNSARMRQTLFQVSESDGGSSHLGSLAVDEGSFRYIGYLKFQ